MTQKCSTRSCAGRCPNRAIRLVTINGARVWVCASCFEEVQLMNAQPYVADQQTSIWLSESRNSSASSVTSTS
jgi:hypothetical protein